MSNKEPGYVYILTNPSFREDWVKIGKSSRPEDVKTLSHTSKSGVDTEQKASFFGDSIVVPYSNSKARVWLQYA